MLVPQQLLVTNDISHDRHRPSPWVVTCRLSWSQLLSEWPVAVPGGWGLCHLPQPLSPLPSPLPSSVCPSPSPPCFCSAPPPLLPSSALPLSSSLSSTLWPPPPLSLPALVQPRAGLQSSGCTGQAERGPRRAGEDCSYNCVQLRHMYF